MRNDPVLPAAKVHNLIFGPESGGGTTTTGGSPNRADNEPWSSSNVVRSAGYYLYRARHYLLTPGGPGDVHNSLTSQFQRRAQKRGVYVSERQAGRIVAYWVNFWVRLMRQDQVPLGLRFTDAEKARGNRRSARSRGQTKTTLSYRAHVLDRAGLDRGQRTIRAYLASPFDTVQAQRQRLARPRPRPRLHVPAAAAICYLLMPPTVKESSEKEVPTDSKLPPHASIDVLAELKKHWNSQKMPKSHNSPNSPPAKATPERKITYAP